MIDREKTIKILECCSVSDCKNCPIENAECCNSKWVTIPLTYLKDLITELKEQDEDIAPIVSTTKQKEFADRLGLAVSDFWCGACRFNLTGRPKFCPNCGKAVKWSD